MVDSIGLSKLQIDVSTLLESLGEGRIDGVAYDTAWLARLDPYYPNQGFDHALEWLRRNQFADGAWGSSLLHHHDRFVSTLAGIVALREAGRHPGDERRVKRGEDVLWKLVGKLGRDDSDTVGFPIISDGLAAEASRLQLDIPRPPARYAEAYRNKTQFFLEQTHRNWLANPITVSFEALNSLMRADDVLLGPNHSVGTSPSATAAYLMNRADENALAYLSHVQQSDRTGAIPAFVPIDIFEIAWALDYLRHGKVITADQPEVRQLLDYLWQHWSPQYGVSHSRYYGATDLDDTTLAFSLLHWGGYEVDPQVFAHYETPTHFCCYIGETNPSVSVQVRLIRALLELDNPEFSHWIEKIVKALYKLDMNGSFWWDKWHSSPYYVSSLAIKTLIKVDGDLTYSRFKWILKTQNDDGGWGYFGESTPEETAYCLQALMVWDREVERIDSTILSEAASYLWAHVGDDRHAPLWIAKSLYTPTHVVKAAILATLWEFTYSYLFQVTH